MDIRKEEDFDKVFKAHPDIDSVIHFAALKVGGSKLEAHPGASQCALPDLIAPFQLKIES